MEVQMRPAVKIMYCLEKFTPMHCPDCNEPFYRENRDFILTHLLGEIRIFTEEEKYSDSIICSECKKEIARIILEVVMVDYYTVAIDKIHEGFVNFQFVQMPVDTKPHRVIFSNGKKVREEEF